MTEQSTRNLPWLVCYWAIAPSSLEKLEQEELMFSKSGEKIDMVATRYDYFPASFRWRGRRLEVMAVEKCWTTQRRQMLRQFRVRTEAGVFVLSCEPAKDVWRVRRWPLTYWLPWLRKGEAPRYPLPRRQRRPALGGLAMQPATARVKRS